MAFRDLLLPALTYPDATRDRALRSGVALARRLGGDLTLMTVQTDIPDLRSPLANALIHLDRLTEAEEARSAAAAQLEANCARIAAEAAGEPIAVQSLRAKLYEEAGRVAEAARTRDLCLLPLGASVLAARDLAETVLFGSGRPVIVYPEDQEIAPAAGFEVVAIAWDGSARAARAVADALPALKAAREVRVFVAVGEKPQTQEGLAQDLRRHLSAHGVAAGVDERLAKSRPIGQTLCEYVAAEKVDLLVMGGFGHARLREFVLGGATEAMLQAPPCPVLMSH
ncbi:MAG: universal stress protein [Pseudomonadota bacterium]